MDGTGGFNSHFPEPPLPQKRGGSIDITPQNLLLRVQGTNGGTTQRIVRKGVQGCPSATPNAAQQTPKIDLFEEFKHQSLGQTISCHSNSTQISPKGMGLRPLDENATTPECSEPPPPPNAFH